MGVSLVRNRKGSSHENSRLQLNLEILSWSMIPRQKALLKSSTHEASRKLNICK
jgi:hypothetical protein